MFKERPPSTTTSSGSGDAFALPGMGGGDEKAVGRDYLLKLLQDG